MCAIHRFGERALMQLDDFVRHNYTVSEYDEVAAYIASKKIKDIKGNFIKPLPVIEAYKRFEAVNLPVPPENHIRHGSKP